MPTEIPTPVPWNTPTPMSFSSATLPVDFLNDDINYTLAEGVVGGYNYANTTGIIDNIMFALVFIIVVGGIWTIVRKVQTL